MYSPKTPHDCQSETLLYTMLVERDNNLEWNLVQFALLKIGVCMEQIKNIKNCSNSKLTNSRIKEIKSERSGRG